MKVYVVWYDNGEEYEDNYQDIEKIFSTREAAEKYLDEEYERCDRVFGGTEWKFPEFVCSMGNIDCIECPKYNEIMYDETGYCCDEDNGMHYPSSGLYNRWTIHEWNVDEFSACGLEGYRDKEIIRYSNLENLVESINPNQRGMVFTKQIAGIEKTVELFRSRGINAVGIWSIHNDKHPMDKEQLRVRESLIKDEKIPDEVQVIVLNASYKVGINIKPEKSRLDYIIVNDSNDDVVTQARGRYRGDIDILYRKETGNASAIASESTIRNIVKPYLGVRLNKEQRNRLREELGIFDNRGLLSWPKTAKLLESYEYVVENKKSGSTRYCVISDASK